MLFYRYNLTIIITILKEISEITDVKIDWKTLVKRSSTGISNAREYQMLWRHLAYREPLFENLVETEPEEDDSDLEFELEAVPSASAEASLQANKCIEVIMPSSMIPDAPMSDFHFRKESHSKKAVHPSTVKNTILLNSVAKKQTLMPAYTGTLQGNEIAYPAFSNKRKRNSWTTQEENDLIAAVKKHGEGNWLNILKDDFKQDRTTSQLSKRWNIIKKRLTSSNLASNDKINDWVLHNEQLATRKAISMALNIPTIGSLSKLLSDARPDYSLEASKKLQQPASPQKTMKKSAIASSLVTPDPLIQAAAVAAGGRIIDPSAAASFLKATNSKNIHRIKNGDISVSKFKRSSGAR
ncbi:uncharacterized protein LOC110101951 [Dendrobium catenatum]|uniref:Uncharacterized protein n=1 Tax=Dendrobium catenatum TaxID=906689 RepID=A0A2I0X6W0_9ASPA|nr:uncharacterized protein LOC110101951 [Dendrobium catenatum]PKU83655.1 hypothetical protein MA16_Dca010048 [Dendrobium catenatum]